jgi:DNA-binding transcriptional regulator YiaG
VTAKQFRNALDRLGLSQLGAARLFDANDRTVRRWAIGERSVPVGVAMMLRLLLAGKITVEDVEAAKRHG